MAKDTRSFAINERISHYVYGPGTISEINHQHTTIDFDSNGRRKFMTSMVQLEPSDLAAPEPPVKPGRARAKSAKSVKSVKSVKAKK